LKISFREIYTIIGTQLYFCGKPFTRFDIKKPLHMKTT